MDEEGHMLVWLRCIWRAELDMRAMERGCQLGSGHVEGGWSLGLQGGNGEAATTSKRSSS